MGKKILLGGGNSSFGQYKRQRKHFFFVWIPFLGEAVLLINKSCWGVNNLVYTFYRSISILSIERDVFTEENGGKTLSLSLCFLLCGNLDSVDIQETNILKSNLQIPKMTLTQTIEARDDCLIFFFWPIILETPFGFVRTSWDLP